MSENNTASQPKQEGKKEESRLATQVQTSLKESNASLLEAVKEPKPQQKYYPENQISPALSSFENRLIKEREVE